MGPMHQLFCGGPFDARQLNHHSHGNTKSFSLSLQRAKGNRRVKCYILRYPDVALSRDNPQGSDETGYVACGKHLFRVGAIPFTAHFTWWCKLHTSIDKKRLCLATRLDSTARPLADDQPGTALAAQEGPHPL
jgi:hypothetical protein